MNEYENYLNISKEYNYTKSIINNMIKYVRKHNISVVYVSETIFDILDMFYYIRSFTYICDPNRQFYEYGFERKHNKNNYINTFFDYD